MSDFTLYFVRHGESVANLSDRNGDKRPDDADRLSERGWEQAPASAGGWRGRAWS